MGRRIKTPFYIYVKRLSLRTNYFHFLNNLICRGEKRTLIYNYIFNVKFVTYFPKIKNNYYRILNQIIHKFHTMLGVHYIKIIC